MQVSKDSGPWYDQRKVSQDYDFYSVDRLLELTKGLKTVYLSWYRIQSDRGERMDVIAYVGSRDGACSERVILPGRKVDKPVELNALPGDLTRYFSEQCDQIKSGSSIRFVIFLGEKIGVDFESACSVAETVFGKGLGIVRLNLAPVSKLIVVAER